MKAPLVALAAAWSSAAVAPATAQPVAPDQTGAGGGPASTITAPNTGRSGVTKVPGTSLGAGEVPSRRERRQEWAPTNRIDNSSCDGCNPSVLR